MTSHALPSRDTARPALRVAFTLAWLIGALLVAGVVLTLAGAASPPALSGDERAAPPAAHDAPRRVGAD